MYKKLRLYIIGGSLGVVFALWVAGPMMPANMRFSDRSLIWVIVMGGPLMGTAEGMLPYHPMIGLGWASLVLLPAYAVHPVPLTAMLTLGSMALWFLAGFLTVIVAVWGA